MSRRAQSIAATVGIVMVVIVGMLMVINFVAGLILLLLCTTSFLLVGFLHRRPRMPRMDQDRIDAEFWRIAADLKAAPYGATPQTEENA